MINPAPQNIQGQRAGNKAEDGELSCPTERGRSPRHSQSHAGAATCGATAPAGRKWGSWQGNLHFPPFYLLCFLNPRKGCMAGPAELHPTPLPAPKNKRPIHSSPSLRAALTGPKLSKTERERRHHHSHSPSRPLFTFQPPAPNPRFQTLQRSPGCTLQGAKGAAGTSREQPLLSPGRATRGRGHGQRTRPRAASSLMDGIRVLSTSGFWNLLATPPASKLGRILFPSTKQPDRLVTDVSGGADA